MEKINESSGTRKVVPLFGRLFIYVYAYVYRKEKRNCREGRCEKELVARSRVSLGIVSQRSESSLDDS